MILLFVCTGNSCRSVMAQYMCRLLIQQHALSSNSDTSAPIEAYSAGVAAMEGMGPSRESVELLAREGIDASHHRSTHLTPELVRSADRIFVMDESHRQHVLAMVPEAADKVHFLRTYGVPGDDEAHLTPVIADPIGQSMEVYEACFAEIKAAVQRIAEHL